MSAERIPIGSHVKISRRGKKGFWTAEFWREGQHRRISLKTANKKVATTKAVALDKELSDGTFQQSAQTTLIAPAIEQYISHLETNDRKRKTIVRYRGELNAFRDFCQGRGVSRLTGITPVLFDAFRAEMKQKHQPFTLYHESMVVKQLLGWCTDRRFLKCNPLDGYRLEKPKRVRRPAPSLEQVCQIRDCFSGSRRTQIAMLAFTGMRVGELQRLLIDDVDMKNGWIHIVSRVGAETKTSESRSVPMHGLLRNLLKEHRSSGPWFFTALPSRKYPTGGHWISPKKLNDRFVEIVKELGFPAGRDALGFTVHSLRRFFETHCVNTGIPQRVIDTWLGHRGDKSMGAVYYDLSEQDSKTFMNKVSFETGMPPAHGGNQED